MKMKKTRRNSALSFKDNNLHIAMLRNFVQIEEIFIKKLKNWNLSVYQKWYIKNISFLLRCLFESHSYFYWINIPQIIYERCAIFSSPFLFLIEKDLFLKLSPKMRIFQNKNKSLNPLVLSALIIEYRFIRSKLYAHFEANLVFLYHHGFCMSDFTILTTILWNC